jgi:signal transduction histidine kinase
VARLRLTLYTTLDRSDRGVEVCLEYLQRGGVRWSPHPTKDEVRQEYERIWLQLGSRSIEELVDLPLMSDPECRATIDVLTEVVTPALFTDENLLCLVICRMANLSLERGNSDGSCFAYVWLGMILGPHFGDYRAGFRFGRLGYELVDKRGLHRYQARAYMSFGNLVIPWSRHIQTGRNLVRLAFDAANKIGDLTFAAYSCNNLNTNLLATGDPLADVQHEAENGLDFARKARFGLVIDIITAQLQLIRTLRGLTQKFGSFDDAQFEESRFEHHLQSDPRLALPECWYWIRKLQARFFAEDYSFAVEASAQAQRLLWTSPSFFEVAEYHFYGSLARAASCNMTPTNEPPQHFRALLAHYEQLALWAENCPENFANRAAMVAAEIARLEGRELDAELLYEQAVRLAREHGFIQNEGIANELAARFYAVRGLETVAHAYLRNARYCYLRWGAEGKVRQLEQSHPQLRGDPTPAPLIAMFGASVQQLDLGAVVKASQAVSGEIVLDRLVKTLMTIAVEDAGAERGMLILLRSDEQPWIEAEARIGRQAVEVTLRQVALTPAELPETVLRTVIRTRQSVILDDAQRSNPFTEDAYVQRRRPRSVLCLPLVKQAELVGLLYLENNLAPGTFTPQRIAVLELLASQAAISLENARLYGELVNEIRDRQKAEDALRRSEASLTEAQQISHTGSWRWKVDTGEVYCSAEQLRIFGFDAATTQPSYTTFMERIDAEDRSSLEQALDRAVRERSRFKHEYRIALPDGSVKHLQSVGQPDITESSGIEFVGTTMDITERRRAEEAVRNAHAELARVARLTTMGELVASIAHEINQPLAAVVTNGDAALRWLNRDKPDLDEARKALSRIKQDSVRAGGVIRGLRDLAKKSGPQLAKLDINDVIQEVLALTRSELRRHGVMLHIDLFTGDQPVLADRVQVQQVLVNLIMNGIEAMRAVTERTRELTVSSALTEPGSVLVAVEDTGTGLDPAIAQRIFEPLFTTKPDGLGMGLSICRSIIEAHEGRLWVSPRAPHGTAFGFTLPVSAEL